MNTNAPVRVAVELFWNLNGSGLVTNNGLRTTWFYADTRIPRPGLRGRSDQPATLSRPRPLASHIEKRYTGSCGSELRCLFFLQVLASPKIQPAWIKSFNPTSRTTDSWG